MKTKVKVMFGIVLSIVLVLSICFSAYARQSKYITSYSTQITNEGNGVLCVTTVVNTLGNVEKISATLELQELIGIKWTTVATWTDDQKNARIAFVSQLYQGTIGSCYRIVGTYYAEKDGYGETKTLTSSSAYAIK